MTVLPTLDPEVADLGLAIGLLTPAPSGVELDSDWFADPATRLTGALADDGRRGALVRFAEAVLARGTHTERDGVILVPVLDLRELSGNPALPDLVVQVSLDARPANYTEVGLAATLQTATPVTVTEVAIPLYRAAKQGKSVAQSFALLDGGVVRVSTDLTLQTAPPHPDEFGLAGVSVAVETALSGGPPPAFTLLLKGLHLPGAPASTVVQIGGPGVSIQDSLLSLVLGLVRQSADLLAGAAATEAKAALDLLGLGGAAGIPTLPVADVVARGVSALQDWFVSLMGSPAARTAWLASLGQLLGGTTATDHVDIPIGAGPVQARLSLDAATGASGHLLLTPRLGLTLATDVAGAITLGAEANAALFTLDVASGAITPVPEAEVVVTATGTGAAMLLQSAAADVGTLRLGLAVTAGNPRAVIQLRNVNVEGQQHDVLDLSTPDAAVAAAGQIAAVLIGRALDALGDAGAELKGLLGLTPPAGATAIDATRLITDPLGTLSAWWHDLVTTQAAHVPDVLTHLRNLIIGQLQLQAGDQVTGSGTIADPWSIPVLTRLRIDCWLDGARLVVAPTLSLRAASTLAGGCTTVQTDLRLELLSVDLAAHSAQFPLAIDFTAQLRATGATEARLGLGPVSIVADFIGVHAAWAPASGFGVDFLAPGLAIDTGSARIPLVLPSVDANGHVNVPPEAWQSVEALIGTLAISGARGWLADLVNLTGWDLASLDPPRLSLAALVTDPVAALKAWVGVLVTDADLLGTLSSTLAHFFGGTREGLAGIFSGSGTPDDPWLATLGRTADLPQLAVWLGPNGPVVAAAQASDAIRQWRPGMAGLGADALAAALADEALAGPEVALLAAGRTNVAAGRTGLTAGLNALAGRWTGTDGMVAPPPDPITGLATVMRADLTANQLAGQPVAALLPGGVPAGAVVVRVAVSPVADLPWTAAAGRLLDLTTPGIAPSSFTVAAPASGEWVVALAPRADATLGGATDPTGQVGQAARLQQVLTALAGAGPIVLVAAGGAGNAARLAADAVPGVTHLLTLGAPWSAATFDTVRTGVPGDALRLMKALLPAPDPDDPDDADLARGRALIAASMAAVRGAASVADLEADRPTLPIRAGLTAVAAFGVLGEETVTRAMTAVFAAGLSARARARVPIAEAPPDTAYAGIRVPFSFLTPPGGHGTTLAGAAMITLGSVARPGPVVAAAPSIHVDLDLAESDPGAWLVGGPGTTPVGGALPLELRRIRLTADIGLHGTPSSARLVLGEGAALGADWVQLVVEPPDHATGTLEALPMLPEARALLGALVAKLAASAPASPAGLAVALLRAVGLADVSGGLVPDALDHLLHDAGAQLRAVPRDALLSALAGLIPALTSTGDTVHLLLGPLTVDADFGAQTLGFSASDSGLITWSAGVSFDATGHPSLHIGLGDPAHDAFALTATSGPLRVQLVRGGAPDVELWPAPDVDGLGRFAAAAVPAEALRVVLDGLRTIDAGVGTALDDLAAALGMLGAADSAGHRAILAPVRLFDDPGGWFGGVLSATTGGPFDAERVIDLLEALKPFVGMDGTPRGVWPVADGITVSAAASAAGPTVSLAVDATSWLASELTRAAFAAGVTANVTLTPSGNPYASVELFVGVPDGPDRTSTPQHRRAAHALVDGAGLRIFLRPGSGADIELFPHLAGLSALLGAGVDAVLPLALNELAKLSGSAVRTQIASLVSSAGRGLAIASDASPAVFDGAAIKALAADPAAYLRAHLADLLTKVVADLDPLLQQVLSLPPTQHVAVLSGSGVLTVTVRTVVIEVHTAPFAVHVSGDVGGLPVIGDVSLSLTADQTGLTAWSAGAGPAVIDLGGPVVRPFARVQRVPTSGWQADIGLGLDALASGVSGHRELAAEWRQADGLSVLVTTQTATDVTEDRTPEGVATAAISAVLDLVGGWVLGVAEVKTLLGNHVGSKTVRFVLQGSILDPAAPVNAPRLLPGVLDGWPGKLLTIAAQLAASGPSVAVGPFQLGIADDGSGVLGVSLTTSNAAGIDLTGDGELSLHLEVDASWIDPPVTPGVVINLLKMSGQQITAAPGISIDGVGLRLAKSNGPLIDAGLRLDSLAVHLFGSIQLDNTQHGAFAGGFDFELGGLAVPLGGGGGDNAVAKGIMQDAGGSGSPPRPAFSPAISVQDHGSGVSVTLRAGSGDGPWFLPIQRAFGPVYLEQVGLGVDYRQGITPRQLEMISLYLSGNVSILGLTAAVDKLRFSYTVDQPIFSTESWEIDVEGFAISSSIGGLTLAGGLRKFPLDPPLSGIEYLGMLKIGFGSYGVDIFGGYAHPTTSTGSTFASFFAFGALHAPIGGPPAFFITGIAVGFGINRDLVTPQIDQITTHPFMQALRALGPTPEPMQQLQQMRAIVPPAQGEYWVAAGISFTSFVLVTGEILVTVQFGDGLEIAVLGLARAQLPNPLLPLVSIELALLARFSSKEGTLLVQAQLTENSYLLHPSVRLTGGFAFQTWWLGPNAGQFVITVGGYHPRFHHDGYPVVPRVGLNWSPIDNISIVGGAYFALCSEALMAGVKLEVAAHLGPAHAKLTFGGDGIVFFDPFWFEVDVYAEAEVGITIWLLFGSIDLDVHLGFDVTVSGPPIHVEGHFSVAGISIPFEFGDKADPSDRALDGPAFAAKYLRGDANAQVVQATVVRGGLTAGKSTAAGSGGVDKPPDGSAESPFRVVPEFQLTFVSIAPVETLQLTAHGQLQSTTVNAPGIGVAPMYSATLNTTLAITLNRDDGAAFTITGIALAARPGAAFPKGVWGPAQNPAAKTVPAGDTITASDGLTIDTVIPDSVFTGAPSIDYHQIELPADGRKPLPFVTNTAQTNARVSQAAALKTAAGVLTAGTLNDAVRFERAALVLAAGGTGRTTVAALRGERSAAPSFGSLADDLEDAPAAVSPPVTPVVVDRDPPPPIRFDPIVKAVMGFPLSMTLDRPAATTVKDSGSAISAVPPTLASVRTANVGNSLAMLTVVPRSGADNQTTIVPVGAAPLTRLASTSVAAVANARPAPAAADRLAALSAGLIGNQSAPAVLHEGELVIITVAQRPVGDKLDTVQAAGGTTRVLCLSAGGRPVDDQIVGAVGAAPVVSVPRETERVVIVALGTAASTAGPAAGWYSGQSLPAIGWGAALCGGAVVSAQGSRIPANRDRADGGWVSGVELATAAQVVTTFTDPVNVVAVAVDDYLGADAAGKVSIRLLDAVRVTDAAGAPRPPEALVDGVRTILLYAVSATGPEPAVLVDDCGGGQLAGVLGSSEGVDGLATLLTTHGIEAAVSQPLVGGNGRRQIRYTSADGPATPPAVPKSVPPKKATPAKAAKKTAAKKAGAKKAGAKKAGAKLAASKKATPEKAAAKKAVAKKTGAKKAATEKASPRKRKSTS